MFQVFLKWHKRIGVTIAIFILIIVATGIAINHADDFDLNKKYIQSEFILDFYNVKPKKKPVTFKTNEHWATLLGKRLYFDSDEVSNNVEKIIGMIPGEDGYVIAHDSNLSIVTKNGELLESLSGADGVPSGMKALGIDKQGNIVIHASHGYYVVNLNELEWNEYESWQAEWSETSSLPEQLQSELLNIYRGKGLTVERLILDLHSGRIAGTLGVYLIDLISIMLMFLAISGLWMWSRR